MSSVKKIAAPRKRRCTVTRRKIAERGDRPRLSIHRTAQHFYAQLFKADGSEVLASASTLEKEVKSSSAKTRTELATMVGNLVGSRAVGKGFKQVAFDRSGFKYHGCVKALADAARASGLEF